MFAIRGRGRWQNIHAQAPHVEAQTRFQLSSTLVVYLQDDTSDTGAHCAQLPIAGTSPCRPVYTHYRPLDHTPPPSLHNSHAIRAVRPNRLHPTPTTNILTLVPPTATNPSLAQENLPPTLHMGFRLPPSRCHHRLSLLPRRLTSSAPTNRLDRRQTPKKKHQSTCKLLAHSPKARQRSGMGELGRIQQHAWHFRRRESRRATS